MQCFNPRKIYRRQGDEDSVLIVPCGHCAFCRSQRQTQWAARLLCESDTHESACFVTLTYNNDNLPEDNGLHKDELQRFFKRLRWYLSQDPRTKGRKIKYFACGEYGSKYFTNRPHYHMIIFGLKPPRDYKNIRPDEDADFILDAWDKGFVTVEPVSWETCRYVVKYLFKQETEKDYDGRQPPFRLSSLGLGKEYLYKHLEEIKKKGCLKVDKNLTIGLPRYFLNKIKDEFLDRGDLLGYHEWRTAFDVRSAEKRLEKTQKMIEKIGESKYIIEDKVWIKPEVFFDFEYPLSRPVWTNDGPKRIFGKKVIHIIGGFFTYDLKTRELTTLNKVIDDCQAQAQREWLAREKRWEEKAEQRRIAKYEALYCTRQSGRRVRSAVSCPY